MQRNVGTPFWVCTGFASLFMVPHVPPVLNSGLKYGLGNETEWQIPESVSTVLVDAGLQLGQTIFEKASFVQMLSILLMCGNLVAVMQLLLEGFKLCLNFLTFFIWMVYTPVGRVIMLFVWVLYHSYTHMAPFINKVMRFRLGNSTEYQVPDSLDEAVMHVAATAVTTTLWARDNVHVVVSTVADFVVVFSIILPMICTVIGYVWHIKMSRKPSDGMQNALNPDCVVEDVPDATKDTRVARAIVRTQTSRSKTPQKNKNKTVRF